MDEQYIIDLYNQLGGEDKFGKFEDFKDLIKSDPSYQKDFYNAFGESTLGAFEDFKSLVSSPTQPTQQPTQQPLTQQPPVKKKEPTGSSWWSVPGISESEPTETKPKQQYTPTTTVPGTDYNVPQKGPIQADIEDADVWKKKAQQGREIVKDKSALPITDYMQGYLKEEGSGVLKAEKEYPLTFLGKKSQEQIEEEVPDFMKPVIEKIDNNLLRQGKDIAKKELDYYLEDAGFDVSYEENTISDIILGISEDSPKNAITITAPDGEVRRFKVMTDDITEADKIKQFVKEKSSLISEKDYLYKNENRKFRSKEEIQNEVKSISNQEDLINEEYKQYLKLQRDISDIKADLKRWEDFGEQNTPKYIQTKAYLEEREKELPEFGDKLKNKASTLIAQQKQLEKAAGKYLELQSEKGTFSGALYRSFMDSAANIYSQYVRMTFSGMASIMPGSTIYSQEQFDNAYRKKLLEEGIIKRLDEPLDGLVMDKAKQAEISSQVDAELRDKFKKAGITGYYDGEKLDNITSINSIRENLSEFLNRPTATTKEYKEKLEKDGSFITRGLLGLSGSIPAMLGGPAIRITNMFMMTTDAVMREMDNDPDFANISENEKALVAMPIGVIGAALEEIGFRGLVNGKSVTTNIVKAVLGRVPSNAPASLVRKTTLDVIAEMGIRGTTAYTGGILSEMETGALQQVNDYLVKDTYNMLKGKKMFDNPEFLSSQYFYDIWDSSRTEGVGAGALGVPYSISAAFQKDGFQALDDTTFKIFEELTKDGDSRKFFVTSLKNKINQGEITAKQSQQMLDAYDQASGMVGRVPDEITDTKARKIAMDLISEKKKLEGKKEKYDDALAKPIQDKINNINEQLTQLTQDAIQKQAASEVSLQPESEPGKEMEAGGPEAGPQAAPQQGILSPEESQRKEELTTALQNIEAGATEVAIGEATMDIADAQAELDALLKKEQATPEVTQEKINDIEKRRKEELSAYDEERLKETYTVGSNQTIGEFINAKYDAELSALQKTTEQATPEAPKQTTTDIFTAAPTETRQAITFTSPDGIIVSLDGNEQMAAQLYDEAIATPEDQRSQQQNKIVEKMQPLVTAAAPAVEVTPVAEVTPTTEQQVAPVQPAETFTEQDRARQQELTDALAKADKRRKNITVGETVMPKADVKAELDALNQKELSSQQPVTAPVTEVAPVAAPTETAPVQTLTPEQEAAELEKLFNAPRNEKPTSPKEKNVIRNTILNAAKAIAKVLPKVNIVVHETIDDYINATGDTEASSGLYVPSADGGTIHINLENSNRRTAGHEVFHAILLRGIKTDAEAQRLAKAMINAVMKSLNQSGNNQELLGKIQEFVSNYDENIQNEESLAEIFGYLADGYPSLDAPTKNIIQRFLDRIAKLFGLKSMTDNDIIDFMNTLSRKVATGEEVSESDINAFTQMKKGLETQGSAGFVGTFLFPRQRKYDEIIKAPSVKEDSRDWIRNVVEDVNIREFEGESFVTNMYDYTNAGVTDLGNGFSINLFGGKNYVPYMMEQRGLSINDVSNLAAFNSKENAEGFIRNSIESGSSLFAPHSGTKKGSWQFQHAIFEELVKVILDKNILTETELIKTFNQGLINKDGEYIAPFKLFRKQYGDISNFNYFKNNPLELVALLDIKNNFSPDLRKRLVDLLISNENFQTSIGIKNKEQFYDKIEDPLNKGVIGGELMGIVKFDPTTFIIRKTNPSDVDHHPSFGWTLDAKIEGIYQPTEFYKSYDVTDSYKKYNKKEVVVSKKDESATLEEYKAALEDKREYTVNKKGKVKVSKGSAPFEGTFEDFKKSQFISSNVSSSAGALPKVAVFENLTSRQQKANKEANKLDQQFPSARKQVTAYHGSPHKFDKFTTDKMGTGEGVQAFGWGLYFTDLKSIAQQYAINLSKPNYDKIQKRLLNSGEKENVINDIIDFSEYYDYDYNKVVDALRKYDNEDAIKYLEKNKDLYEASEGNLYQVTLHQGKSPDQYTWLEWTGKPNKEQIQELFSKLTREQIDEAFYYGLPPNATNETIYKGLSKIFKSPQKASLFLLENGIDGIKFPAESISRGATSETARGFNYVVFDENAIEITARHQKAKKELKDIIKTARANGYSDEGIRIYLKKIGLEDADIDTLLQEEKGAGKKITVSEKTLPGYDKLMNRIAGVIDRSRKRGLTDEKIMENVINNVEANSPEYANATDQQREQIIRDIRAMFGKKEKKAPTAEKILGKPKPETQTKTVNALRKEFWTAWNKSAREAKGDMNTKRKMLAAAIDKMAASGVLSAKQAEVLAKRVSLVNLNNPDAVQKLIDYAGKLFKDAEYGAKLKEANKLRNKIKELSKSKDKFGNLTPFAAEFAKIDPSMLENIDEYLEMAKAVSEGVEGSKLTPKGVKPSDAVNVEATMKYVEKSLEEQKKEIERRTAEKVESLLGIDANDLTYDQMMALLEQPESDKVSDAKERIVRSFINKMFNTYSTIIKSMFNRGIDPFSDPENPTKVDFTKEQKALVEEFMGMDLSKLSVRDALRAADALNNFIVNKSTANMGTVVARYRGEANANKLAKEGIVSKALKFLFSKAFGKFNAEQIVSLPLLFERMFKSADTGLKVMRAMGFNKIANGAAKATTTVSRTITAYLNEFSSSKPNGKAFNDAFNITERGMVAFMSRSIIGTDKQIQEEFNDRKALIEESIEELQGGTKEEQDKAKVYQEVYDKILKDSKNSSEVKQKADKKNVEAVDWWVNEWSKHYDQLADVSLNIYNTVLDKDAYYTTDRLSKLSSQKDTEIDDDASAFHQNNGNISEKKAGALMEARDKKQGLPKDKDGKVSRYVNLSFDSVNASSLYDALTDINTAEGIKQVKAFQNSKAYKRIFPNADDRAILDRRISLAVKNIRNQNQFDNSELDKVVRALDTIARFSASMTLAGPTQIPKQTVSIAINTLVNAGKISLNYIGNADKIKFVNNSGRAIANRGAESQVHLESINRMMEEAAKSKTEAGLRLLKQANDLYLKWFLANPDAYIAKASWLAYYEQSLKKQGKLPKGGIDYSNHEQNEEAADYAQMMVDRQQNITDTRLAGALYSPEGGAFKKILTRVFLPLASFRMNQFQRMASDVTNFTSRTASYQEKKNAFRSLAAFGAEQAVFKGMVVSFGLLYYLIADIVRGDEPDEEEWKKRRNNLLKAQATGAVTDVFSPIPLTDPFAKYGVNTGLSLTQDLMGVAEEDKLSIFTDDIASGSTYAKALGMYGISIDKALGIHDNIMLSLTGKYEDKYGNEKFISEGDRELLKWSIVPSIILNMGILPGAPEWNNVMGKITKAAKNDAMTEPQLKEYRETGRNKEEAKKYSEERKAMKEEAYGGYETLEEFEEKDPEKFDEYSAPGGKLYKYRESVKLEEKEKNKDKPLTEDQIEKLKKENPREWRENYGPGTEYFIEQNTPEKRMERVMKKREEAQRAVQKKIREREERIRKAQERYGR